MRITGRAWWQITLFISLTIYCHANAFAPTPSRPKSAAAKLFNLPISFHPYGQENGEKCFRARGRAYALSLTATQTKLALVDHDHHQVQLPLRLLDARPQAQ